MKTLLTLFLLAALNCQAQFCAVVRRPEVKITIPVTEGLVFWYDAIVTTSFILPPLNASYNGGRERFTPPLGQAATWKTLRGSWNTSPWNYYSNWSAANPSVTLFPSGGGFRGDQPRLTSNTQGYVAGSGSTGTNSGTINQPYTIAAVFVTRTGNAATTSDLTGDTANHHILGYDGANHFRQFPGTSSLLTSWASGNAASGTNWYYCVFVFNNTASFTRTNGVLSVYGSGGTAAPTATSFLLFAEAGQGSNWKGDLSRLAMWNINPTTNQIQLIESWCRRDYSFPNGN